MRNLISLRRKSSKCSLEKNNEWQRKKQELGVEVPAFVMRQGYSMLVKDEFIFLKEKRFDKFFSFS